MLQISTGKLFGNGIERKNHLTGVIYSNLRFFGEKRIETPAGTILPTSHLSSSMALVYELTENIEKQELGPGVLVSHGIEPYISDFSAIMSFSLNCIATPDHDLANRLKSEQRGLSTPSCPKKIVTRFFDSEIISTSEDKDNLEKFVKQLIGLERNRYLGVMRAIRTFITGMHRIADDLDLAYTLIVASIESLAQDFDGHTSTWEDLDYRKRKILDNALKETDPNTIEKIKSAILEIEHTALSRRFKSFATDNIADSFFRLELSGIEVPIARSELASGLGQAYTARSRYIHNLRELPKILTLGHLTSESMKIEDCTWFTLQGLSRLARHIITEFIYKQPTVESEVYNYHLESAGIIRAPMAPQYWIGNADNMSIISGAKRLEGFLQQFSQHILNPSNATITDLLPVLNKVEPLLFGMKKNERLPFVSLYFLFNGLLTEEKQMSGIKKVESHFFKELLEPSSESLVYHLLFELSPDWELTVHEKELHKYFKRRDNKSKFRLPRLFEAAVILELAERWRALQSAEKTREYVSFALDNYPECKRLREYEKNYSFSSDLPIKWSEILLPNDKNKTPSAQNS